MTNGPYLAEADNFDTGIYQLQTTDPALGGPSGIMNVPPTSLANRSRYLLNRLQDGKMTYAADSGVANAYVALLNPVTFAALVDGMEVRLRVANANTAASTFTPSNGTVAGSPNIAPLPILGGDGSALTGGEFAVNSEVTLRYNAALNSGNGAWVIMSSVGGVHRAVTPPPGDNSNKVATTNFVQQALQNNGATYAVDTGVANAYVALVNPVTFSALADGMTVRVRIAHANTAAATFTPSNGTVTGSTNIAPLPIYDMDGNALVGGELVANGEATFRFNAALNAWIIMESAGGVHHSVTPAQFDNSSKTATTAFVQRALGNFSGVQIYNASQVITAAQAGELIEFNGAAVATFTIPNPSTVVVGGSYTINNYGTANLTVTTAGGVATFNPWTGTPTSIVILPGQSVEVAADGTYYVVTSVSGNIATPAQFDNSNKQATTGFVKASGFQYPSTFLTVNAAQAIPVSAMNGVVDVIGAASYSLTLPSVAACPVGSTLSFISSSSSTVTLALNGSDTYGNASGQTLTLQSGSTLVLKCAGGGVWWVMAGSEALRFMPQFGSLLSANGYKKVPDPSSPTGYSIFQWGTISLTGTATSATASFPTTFPNGCLNMVSSDSGNTAWASGVGPVSNSQYAIYCNPYSSNSGALVAKNSTATLRWWAFGY